MEIQFHEYIGLAGDEHLLLVGIKHNIRFSELFNRSRFYNFNLNRAKKKITKLFERYERENSYIVKRVKK